MRCSKLLATMPLATPSVIVSPRFSGKPMDQARSPAIGNIRAQAQRRQLQVVGPDHGQVVLHVDGIDLQHARCGLRAVTYSSRYSPGCSTASDTTWIVRDDQPSSPAAKPLP